MLNRNIVQNNLKTINQLLTGYDEGKKTHDDLLKTYNDAIKQIPDHYNKIFNNKQVMPTTIAAAAKRFHRALNTRDVRLLKIDPKKYMHLLHQARKEGLWTLFDYSDCLPFDSNSDLCQSILQNYRDGLEQELELTREAEKDTADEELDL